MTEGGSEGGVGDGRGWGTAGAWGSVGSFLLEGSAVSECEFSLLFGLASVGTAAGSWLLALASARLT